MHKYVEAAKNITEATRMHVVVDPLPMGGSVFDVFSSSLSAAEYLRRNLASLQKQVFVAQALVDVGNKFLLEAGEAPSRVSYGLDCNGKLRLFDGPDGMPCTPKERLSEADEASDKSERAN